MAEIEIVTRCYGFRAMGRRGGGPGAARGRAKWGHTRIVLNPVRAHMVEYVGKYRWSNYRATAGLAIAPSWLHTEWTLDQFPSKSLGGSRERYRKFVAAGRGASFDPSERLIGQIFLARPWPRSAGRTAI